jgi:hypothetical protein
MDATSSCASFTLLSTKTSSTGLAMTWVDAETSAVASLCWAVVLDVGVWVWTCCAPAAGDESLSRGSSPPVNAAASALNSSRGSSSSSSPENWGRRRAEVLRFFMQSSFRERRGPCRHHGRTSMPSPAGTG